MKRIIAAILAADVVGYSRLMAEDEEATLERLAGARTVFEDAVARFGGRVFNTAGDAILAVFPSAVEALRAALAIQGGVVEFGRETAPGQRIRFRMGLTLGDVAEVGGDLLGDAVNVAARLEGLSEPDGICLSRTLHEAVLGKVRVAFRDIGEQKLKNIPRPVHAFRVVMPGDPAVGTRAGRGRGRAVALAAVLATVLLAVVAVGWALHRRGERSEAASPRQGPLFQVVAGGAIDLVAEASLADLGRVRGGQAVTVRALGGPELTGRVRRADPDVEAGLQVGRVRIELPRDPDVRVGTFARGTITVERRCGLSIPYSAVQYGTEATFVQIVDGDRVETRRVEVGLVSGGEAEIRSGLTASDLVVIRAAPFVREGDVVEAVASP